ESAVAIEVPLVLGDRPVVGRARGVEVDGVARARGRGDGVARDGGTGDDHRAGHVRVDLAVVGEVAGLDQRGRGERVPRPVVEVGLDDAGIGVPALELARIGGRRVVALV